MIIISILLNTEYLKQYIDDREYEHIQPQIDIAHNLLHSHKGVGNEFTGWINYASKYGGREVSKINSIAANIRETSDIFIVIGIGGSYLGAKAAIDFLMSPSYNYICKKTPKIFYIGNNISSDSIYELLKICKNKDISLNIISKSGGTLEPAIAFRIFKNFMEKKYGKDGAKKRIYCTTDKNHGILRQIADYEGYMSLEIPENIGGRFSVLTPVGLLPIAVSGADIQKLLNGTIYAEKIYGVNDINVNYAYKYAGVRNILYKKGKICELLVGYQPRLSGIMEWWKQLFGESEGKNGKGIFPSASIFTTDLHSLGQFIQDGSKIFFETVINIKSTVHNIIINSDKNDLDKLNFLSGMSVEEINQNALKGTLIAHSNGDVPNIVINIDNNSEYELGQLLYFFEKACAISGYILGVNPFDQPGVEIYKRNMLSLLHGD